MKGIPLVEARAAISLTLLLLVTILLIRARPYDDQQITDLLLPPEGCPAPCFMGLHLGQATLEEATRLLERQRGVRYFIQQSTETVQAVTVLYWRDEHSPLNGSMSFIDNRLAEVTLSGLYLYHIWLALGEPDGGQMVTEMIYIDDQQFVRVPTVHIGYYSVNQFRVNIASTCTGFWDQRAHIVMGQAIMPDQINPTQSLSYQRQIACQMEKFFRQARHEAAS